jgi:hypothetical protein
MVFAPYGFRAVAGVNNQSPHPEADARIVRQPMDLVI